MKQNNLEIILNTLKVNGRKFNEIISYSEKPGIYALFFCGEKFPYSGYKPGYNEIIYIGKTEKSQKSRNLNTHFEDGKTGSSTIRRSIGALLREEMNLIPIPRNKIDVKKGRITYFKFDTTSEVNLTKWMKGNLGLAFYEYPKSKSEIDVLESELIAISIPILNIDRKNPKNPFSKEIKNYRKITGQIAHSQTSNIPKLKMEKKTKEFKNLIQFNKSNSLKKSKKYCEIWDKFRTEIIANIKSGNSTKFKIGEGPFKQVGKRKSYSFNLEFNNGQVSNNIDGSAVARDLLTVLEAIPSFKENIKGKSIKLNLDKHFILHLTI